MMNNAISKIRFTWNISYDCNYRCSYCFFDGKWDDYSRRNIYLSVEDWMKHWNRICEKHGQIFLIITGGEPFIYPNFIQLVKELSRICFHINVSTNSSMDLMKFVKEIDPKKASISLSFQREFDSLEVFIERVKLIRKYNFNGCLNLVAYPSFLEELENDKNKLKTETGEEFKIVPFFGKYKNIWTLQSAKGPVDLAAVLWSDDIYNFNQFWNNTLDKYGNYFEKYFVSILTQVNCLKKSYLLLNEYCKSDREFYKINCKAENIGRT